MSVMKFELYGVARVEIGTDYAQTESFCPVAGLFLTSDDAQRALEDQADCNPDDRFVIIESQDMLFHTFGDSFRKQDALDQHAEYLKMREEGRRAKRKPGLNDRLDEWSFL